VTPKPDNRRPWLRRLLGRNSPSPPSHELKLHLGSGADYRPGYLNIDSSPSARVDLRMDFTLIDTEFEPESVGEILMVHSLNYLRLWQARDLFAVALRLLRKDGVLIIETVDVEKVARRVLESAGRVDEYLEGIRGFHAFDMNQIARREPFVPYAFSWSGWHLDVELRRAGFDEVQILPPQTHAAWRDIRVEARKALP
jgi:hypothetical protein